ncbi:2-C-methyl-D-erythritol 4-phosphate cytidylyltransferase [hydrothermal vent metagenome]|uniref:2-C-methyl-D-erythritol 4-phosphate cytidylyltransferase n=1 Tax=hydrothermal vent metagenome TaxID=652676 RepID=A0A3B1DS59_9ZZZZ
MKPVIAIIPAAGSGRRFGGGKTLLNLKGMPVIARTLSALQAVDEIVEIIPVMRNDEMEQTLEIVEKYGFTKVRKIAPGGRERQESVSHGLALIERKGCIVLVHDGVRPLVTPEIIRNAIAALGDLDGVVTAVAVKDTIKEVVDGMVRKTLAREVLFAVQTPQVFPYAVLMEAYAEALKSGMHFTDDAAMVEHNGGRVKVVEGEYSNIKITTREDLDVAEAFLKNRS